MKKLCALWIALLCAATSHAQLWDNSKPDRLLTFGIRAGVNVTGLTKSDYYYQESNVYGYDGGKYHLSLKPKLAPYAGVNVDINIVKSFAVETGLFYNCDEYFGVVRFDADVLEDNLSSTIHYLQLPVAALFRFPVSSDFYLSAKLGGYLSVIVSDPGNVWWFEPESAHAGIVTGIGAGYKNWSLNVQPQFGITRGLSRWNDEAKFRNVIVTLGYDF